MKKFLTCHYGKVDLNHFVDGPHGNFDLIMIE